MLLIGLTSATSSPESPPAMESDAVWAYTANEIAAVRRKTEAPSEMLRAVVLWLPSLFRLGVWLTPNSVQY